MFADPHTAGPLDKAAILRRFRQALKAAHESAFVEAAFGSGGAVRPIAAA